MSQRPPATTKITGWRRARGRPALAEVFGSIATRPTGSFWRKLITFLGPGYLVAVGYMDPGNWATSLAGGSKFGYALLTVALLSNLMAILLQALCARLGIGAGRDLAQACRDAFPRALSWPLWVLTEIAICATDLAEVIGTAIGLNLLFHIPLEIGVLITALDVFLVLWMQNLGFRWIEAFIVTLMGVIALCFVVQIAMANPDWAAVIKGFAPTTEIIRNPDMLYLAIGIIGATVMPHNLYLHSGVVQTRRFGTSVADRREAIKLATIDSTIALMFALTINASILILAAATFNKAGKVDVAELDQAHAFLAPLLGSTFAPTLFGIALLCCGLNSTVTATLSGQIVMEGFIDIRLPGWAQAVGDAVNCDRAGGNRDHLVRRGRHGETPDPESGRARRRVAILDRALGDVHRRPAQDGSVGGAGVGDRAGGADGAGADRAEFQAFGRPIARLSKAGAGYFSTRLQPDGIRRSCGRKRPL